MKGLAVLLFMLGVSAMLLPWISGAERDALQLDAVAVNYALYRNQVINHALKNKATGVITSAALQLPESWRPLRAWQNRVDQNGQSRLCYVYGPATPQEIAAVRDLFKGSFAVGRKENGGLVPAHGVAMPLPAYIPEGNLVTVIEMQP